MSKLSLFIIFFVILVSCKTAEIIREHEQNYDSRYTLKNQKISLSIERNGGAFTYLVLNNDTINPFTWKLSPEEMPSNNRSGAPFRGHFLCLGRWGSPTKGEIAKGVPHNGEPANTRWTIKKMKNNRYIAMTNIADKDGLSIFREVFVDSVSPVFKVSESVTNITPIFRLNNIVQHATIGPPFLDTTTIICTNAKKGFLQESGYPNPYSHEYEWPWAFSRNKEHAFDLRRSNKKFNYVSTHLFEDDWGWVTAYNPEYSILLGYLWKVTDYPWINIWQQWRNNKLWAKGLEFGTTGIGRSYQELLSHNTRFYDHNSFEFIDAGEKVQKNYFCFMVKVPQGFGETSHVIYKEHKIIINGKYPVQTIELPLSKDLRTTSL